MADLEALCRGALEAGELDAADAVERMRTALAVAQADIATASVRVRAGGPVVRSDGMAPLPRTMSMFDIVAVPDCGRAELGGVPAQLDLVPYYAAQSLWETFDILVPAGEVEVRVYVLRDPSKHAIERLGNVAFLGGQLAAFPCRAAPAPPRQMLEPQLRPGDVIQLESLGIGLPIVPDPDLHRWFGTASIERKSFRVSDPTIAGFRFKLTRASDVVDIVHCTGEWYLEIGGSATLLTRAPMVACTFHEVVLVIRWPDGAPDEFEIVLRHIYLCLKDREAVARHRILSPGGQFRSGAFWPTMYTPLPPPNTF